MTDTVTVYPEVGGLAKVALERLLESRKKRKKYMREYRRRKAEEAKRK